MALISAADLSRRNPPAPTDNELIPLSSECVR
jgi:hypothetical protein